MYQLIKIQNARTNVPEPMRIPLNSPANVGRGLPITIQNGAVSVYGNNSAALPTHMTLCASNEACVLCYEITRDMIFEASLSTSALGMEIGGEYLLSEDGKQVTGTAVSGSLRGATLIAKSGACAAGDKILVSFR